MGKLFFGKYLCLCRPSLSVRHHRRVAVGQCVGGGVIVRQGTLHSDAGSSLGPALAASRGRTACLVGGSGAPEPAPVARLGDGRAFHRGACPLSPSGVLCGGPGRRVMPCPPRPPTAVR